MPELALDDVERQTLASELERVRVAQLMRCEPAPDPGHGGQPVELKPDGCSGPRPSTRGAIDDAEQRPDRQLAARREPGPTCSQSSIPTSRRRPPLPLRTRSEPSLTSRSCSASASASWMRSPARHNTTIFARGRQP